MVYLDRQALQDINSHGLVVRKLSPVDSCFDTFLKRRNNKDAYHSLDRYNISFCGKNPFAMS